MDLSRVNLMRNLLYNQIKLTKRIKNFMKRVSSQLLIPDKNCIKSTLNVKDHNFQKQSFMKFNSSIYIVIKLYRNKC